MGGVEKHLGFVVKSSDFYDRLFAVQKGGVGDETL